MSSFSTASSGMLSATSDMTSSTIDSPTAGLESLPYELILNILPYLASAAELVAIISASPQCLRVFLQNQDAVLEPIVRRVIPPENMSYALAACRGLPLPDTYYLLLRSGDYPQFGYDIDDFIEEHRTEGPVDPSEVDDAWYRLLKLSRTVDCWIDQISENAYTQLKPFFSLYRDMLPPSGCERGSLSGTIVCGDDDAQQSKILQQSLSATEYLRLQRAFFRFERYRRIYMTARSTPHWDHFMPAIVEGIFIRSLQRWEKQEMACVFAFVTERLEIVIDRTEDYLIEELGKSIIGGAKSLPDLYGIMRLMDRRNSNNPNLDDDKTGVAQGSSNKPVNANQLRPLQGMVGLQMFKKSWRYLQRSQVEFMAAMGLPFVRYLCKQSPRDQMKMASSHSAEIFKTFSDVFYRLYMQGENADEDLAAHVDVLGAPNSAWLWARNCKPLFMYSPSEERYTRAWMRFASLGLVFGDKGRLQESGLFKHNLEYMEFARWHGGLLQSRYDLSSVEEMFAGTVIEKEDVAKLEPDGYLRADETELLRTIDY